MKKLAVIGSGELGMQIAHQASLGSTYTAIGFYDDTEHVGKVKNGYPVLGNSSDIENGYRNGDFEYLVMGIGYKHLGKRKELFEQLKGKVPFANIIHPTCYIDPTAQLGEGIVMYPGCVIDKEVLIADNVLLNVNVFFAHNTIIKPHSFFSADVKVAGATTIGECINFGIGTTVIDNLIVCDNVQTGACTLVIKNIETPGLYIGSPAKFLRS